MSDPDEKATVSYTVKELLAQLRSEQADTRRELSAKLDALTVVLDQKASQTSVDHIDKRLAAVEVEVQNLKTSRSQLMAVVALISFVIPVAVALVVHYA